MDSCPDSSKSMFRSLAESRPASMLLLCVIFWITAAASFSGFYGKWKLLDGQEKNGIEQILNASAHKPFVYRQLVPMLSALANQLTPDSLKNDILKVATTKVKSVASMNRELAFRYMTVYVICFFSLFFSLLVLREITLDAGAGKVAAVFAPLSFALAFPYLQTKGGYYYDITELLFLSLAFLAASRGRILLLLTLLLPATLNKETFIFFIPALYPLLRCHFSMKKVLILISAAIFAAGIVNILTKLAFYDLPGGALEFYLLQNLRAFINPQSYGQLEITYGIIGPSGTFIGTLAVVLIILFRGWPQIPLVLKRHLFIASAINFPLFLLFAYPGELRNLSFLFIGFVILMAFVIEQSGSIFKSSVGLERRQVNEG